MGTYRPIYHPERTALFYFMSRHSRCAELRQDKLAVVDDLGKSRAFYPFDNSSVPNVPLPAAHHTLIPLGIDNHNPTV